MSEVVKAILTADAVRGVMPDPDAVAALGLDEPLERELVAAAGRVVALRAAEDVRVHRIAREEARRIVDLLPEGWRPPVQSDIDLDEADPRRLAQEIRRQPR